MPEPASELIGERNQRWDEPFDDEPLDAATVAYILSLPTFANVDATEFQTWLPLDQIIANDGRLRRYQAGEVILRKGDYGNSLFVILEGGVLTVPAKIENDAQGQAPRRGVSWWRSIAQLFARAKPPEYRSSRRRWHRHGAPVSPSPLPSGLGKVDIDDVKKRHPTIVLQSPDVFGELAALTGSQRIATVIATEDDTLLFELRWQGVRDIRTWSTSFRRHIDRSIAGACGLIGRLRECPLLHHLDNQALDEIARESLFETYGNAEWMPRFKKERQRADVSRM